MWSAEMLSSVSTSSPTTDHRSPSRSASTRRPSDSTPRSSEAPSDRRRRVFGHPPGGAPAASRGPNQDVRGPAAALIRRVRTWRRPPEPPESPARSPRRSTRERWGTFAPATTRDPPRAARWDSRAWRRRRPIGAGRSRPRRRPSSGRPPLRRSPVSSAGPSGRETSPASSAPGCPAGARDAPPPRGLRRHGSALVPSARQSQIATDEVHDGAPRTAGRPARSPAGRWARRRPQPIPRLESAALSAAPSSNKAARSAAVGGTDHAHRELGPPPAQAGGDDLDRAHRADGVARPVDEETKRALGRGLQARVVDLVEEVLQGTGHVSDVGRPVPSR